MGKIHKALEKAKLEQQNLRKKPYHSLKTPLKIRRQDEKVLKTDRKQNKQQSKEESNLGSIHNLLKETGKIEPAERDVSSNRNAGITQRNEKELNTIKPLIDRGDAVDKESGLNKDPKDKRENSPPTTLIQNKEIPHNDKVVTKEASQEIKGRVARPLVSLKSNQQSEPEVQYIRNDSHSTPSKLDEAFYHQGKTKEPTRLHYSLITLGKPKSFEAEQFKILRANLLFPKSGKPPKTILLTSAVPGEGKTFTAINLAVSLAQNINSHVLLVDADIRKPEIHKRFGLGQNIYGLSDFLTQNMPIPSLLVKTPLSNLTILPGGQATINPSELISSDKMKSLLHELSTRYSDRFVVIDAPPPKLAAETYALARFVEHIIPVVRAERTNRELVEEMMTSLGRDKIQGVVLNCYDIRNTKRFGYHKYSGYYSK